MMLSFPLLVNKSIPTIYRGIVGSSVEIIGSFYYLHWYLLHVSQFWTSCLISLRMLGQNTESFALLSSSSLQYLWAHNFWYDHLWTFEKDAILHTKLITDVKILTNYHSDVLYHLSTHLP